MRKVQSSEVWFHEDLEDELLIFTRVGWDGGMRRSSEGWSHENHMDELLTSTTRVGWDESTRHVKGVREVVWHLIPGPSIFSRSRRCSIFVRTLVSN